ncbi:hypothetical protein PIIN_03666 [Serendipita indica DSM 11827]|uniref:Uncharacterized protein n=1 Tax=Serendipita indica (strain DSM 11827) TaxID=1109443 RepID=G4TEI2_SERID|nr:hypothetical protein PIIN_03666 [Serendipita indica DSM 11827]
MIIAKFAVASQGMSSIRIRRELGALLGAFDHGPAPAHTQLRYLPEFNYHHTRLEANVNMVILLFDFNEDLTACYSTAYQSACGRYQLAHLNGGISCLSQRRSPSNVEVGDCNELVEALIRRLHPRPQTSRPSASTSADGP